MAAGQWAIKFLQIAAGLWPVEKLANLPAYGRLYSLPNANGCIGCWPMAGKSLQIAVVRLNILQIGRLTSYGR
jgi:hypothetical protein